jgi:hypothetical protein
MTYLAYFIINNVLFSTIFFFGFINKSNMKKMVIFILYLLIKNVYLILTAYINLILQYHLKIIYLYKMT